MTEEISFLKHNVVVEDINNLNKISTTSDSDSDGDEIQFKKAKPRLKRLTESDSDTDKENDLKKVNTILSPQKSDSDQSNNGEVFATKKKSRIRSISNSDSDSLPGTGSIEQSNKYDLSRTKIKNQNLQDKFRKLKKPKSIPKENHSNDQLYAESDGGDTDNSSDGESSCSKIKQKLKKKSSHSLTAICDPDTSEEESNVNFKDVKVQKTKPRSTKLTSPKPEKPARMSAKQAMENMQKIKSESNRMLREKEVSLPYHRPKALTLKDIMNRRKPALTSDGKALPIKMNNEQLRQYSLMLEQRQKEMMELCKSETDEEEENEEQLSENKFEGNTENNDNKTTLNLNHKDCDTSDANDKTFDDINMEHNINDSRNNLNEQNIQKVIVSETLEDNSKNSENETDDVEENQEQPMEISILHEEHDSPSSNCSNKDTVNTAEEEGQVMKVLPESELQLKDVNKNKERESQVISLHYDSEKTEPTNSEDKTCDLEGSQVTKLQEVIKLGTNDKSEDNGTENTLMNNDKSKINSSDEFSDNDFTMEEIEKIIEKAEVNKGTSNKPLPTLEMKPMLTGTPGMVIDLDDNDENTQKKLTGMEILKERYKYFAKLKSEEEMEKDREKKFKPGIQHLKLKQKLEEEIAEQRSLEWEKRLQVENQLKSEMNTIEEEEFDGEDIEKIEAKLEENDVIDDEDKETSSEEEIEDTDVYDVKEKPRVRNPLIDDEAEVSEDEDVKNVDDVDCNKEGEDDNDDDENNEDDESDSDEDDDEESSESEDDEQQTKCRKGRILKAFEDSDDEEIKSDALVDNTSQSKGNEIRESQDDEIHLAQPQKTYSDDLFSSQECATQKALNRLEEPKVADTSLEDLGSQTFSLNTGTENIGDRKDVSSEKMDVICETQPCSDDNFEAIVGMCTGGFSQNVVTPQAESSQLSQSQEIGDDVAELCTGKFYDNPFVSQTEAEVDNNETKTDDSITESTPEKTEEAISEKVDNPKPRINEGENKLLKSILDELDDPEFDAPKPNKYFFNATKKQDKEGTVNIENTQFKKKFVIESDDEMNENDEGTNKKKKRKKRKMENRALQISDDEEEEYSEVEQETYESEIEEDNDRLVEYDSEENEVEILAKPKKKRVGAFFEQEAELTSEDEWVGSGDEDEAGLDRMEREEGDDDTFNQGKLQRELGEIHMREVMDQDKREVRLLQELLFEDDLGDGHRQRKFRWKDAVDGEEAPDTTVDELGDTQEDEGESEEQWRRQRHEREMFLRKLQEKDEDDANVSINRSAFIKATLASKTTASTTLENSPNLEKKSSPETKPHDSVEKKTANSIPSPKKPFILLQQNYHNSLLTRGRGALARLAALATPLAGDGDDAPKVNASSNRGNFVFAAITPDAGTKTTKRKADTAPDTPRLLKKMKQESNKPSKSSLLDHL